MQYLSLLVMGFVGIIIGYAVFMQINRMLMTSSAEDDLMREMRKQNPYAWYIITLSDIIGLVSLIGTTLSVFGTFIISLRQPIDSEGITGVFLLAISLASISLLCRVVRYKYFQWKDINSTWIKLENDVGFAHIGLIIFMYFVYHLI